MSPAFAASVPVIFPSNFPPVHDPPDPPFCGSVVVVVDPGMVVVVLVVDVVVLVVDVVLLVVVVVVVPPTASGSWMFKNAWSAVTEVLLVATRILQLR